MVIFSLTFWLISLVSTLFTIILVWNIVPHIALWRLKDVPLKHKILGSKSFVESGLKGLYVLPFDLVAPVAVALALLKTKFEDDHLPAWAAAWENDVSINGDRPEYWPLDYKGDCYYCLGSHPRSFKARWVWLGLRNRASALSKKLGIPITPELDADRQFWGDENTDRNREGYCFQRAGSTYQLYIIKFLGDKLCFRLNYGFKVRNVQKTALVVNISGSILSQKPATPVQS